MGTASETVNSLTYYLAYVANERVTNSIRNWNKWLVVVTGVLAVATIANVMAVLYLGHII